MELILIIIASILCGAINFGFFIFGYRLGEKEAREEFDSKAVELTKENARGLEDFVKWMNYGGK